MKKRVKQSRIDSIIGTTKGKELRESHPDSIFLEEKYDRAICGIDPVTGAIFYHTWEIAHICMEEENHGRFDIYKDCSEEFYEFYDEQLISIFNEFSCLWKTYAGTDKVSPMLYMEIDE